MPSFKRQIKLDKFIVKKNCTTNPSISITPKNKSIKKQVTLESLKGFIDPKDFDNALAVFRESNPNTFRLQMLIEKFIEKLPTRSMLEQTNILKMLENFSGFHEDNEVRRLAGILHEKWTLHFEVITNQSNKPLIDVTCDARTNRVRKEAKYRLKCSLNVYLTCTMHLDTDPEDLHLNSLADSLERPIYYFHHTVDDKYQANVRAACRIIESFSSELSNDSLPFEIPADLWTKLKNDKIISEKWNVSL